MELESISPVSAPEPWIIAGPCSAETEKQTLETASQLARKGIKIFRAGLWKPRTRPGGFEGVGAQALPWLVRVQKETGLKTMIEVASAKHVEAALAAGIDMCWIGARTAANPFSVQEIADALKGVDLPVFVKNPINSDLNLWIGAIERIYNSGIRRIAAIHRGFSSYYETKYRNTPLWHIPIELRHRIPDIPLICDPSHICGKRELIPAVARQAIQLAFNGLMIESHCCPAQAWTDSSQQLTPDELFLLLQDLPARPTTPRAIQVAESTCALNSLQEFMGGVQQMMQKELQRLDKK